MKCANSELVADILPHEKETFSIECGNIKETPTFETPPEDKWPRCIPKVCIPYLKKHQVITQIYTQERNIEYFLSPNLSEPARRMPL